MNNINLHLNNRVITTNNKAFIMGMVSVTSNLFYSNVRYGVNLALQFLDEGADLIDIEVQSGQSKIALTKEEEIAQILQIVKAIRNHSDIPISINSTEVSVLKAAYEHGADIINDSSALEDSAIGDFAASTKLPVIITHKRNPNLTNHINAAFHDTFYEVEDYLFKRVDYALKLGIDKEKIILNPGIEAGKDKAGYFELIRRCGKILGGTFPILMTVSNNPIISGIVEQNNDNLSSVLTAGVLSVLNGASIIRVHDVKHMVESMKVLTLCSNS